QSHVRAVALKAKAHHLFTKF
ncbi:hypothetical protein Gotur_012779, partial [Gossypium turneri]